MNVPGKLMKYRPDVGTAMLRAGTFVSEKDGIHSHREAAALYLECCRQIVLDDDFGIHVIMMPGNPTATSVYCVGEDDGFAEDVAHLMDREIRDGDMVVVLGDAVLDGNLGENEMLEIALADLSGHIDRLWPIADRSTGWIGRHIGWAAAAGVIAGAHTVLRLLDPADAVMERVKNAAGKWIIQETRFRIGEGRESMLHARPAMEAVENICDNALETHGEYLCLPASGHIIAEAAKAIFLDAVDGMVR